MKAEYYFNYTSRLSLGKIDPISEPQLRKYYQKMMREMSVAEVVGPILLGLRKTIHIRIAGMFRTGDHGHCSHLGSGETRQLRMRL